MWKYVPGVPTLAPCNLEYKYSYPAKSNQVYVTHTNKEIGNIAIVRGEYGNGGLVLGIIRKLSNVNLQLFRYVSLLKKNL